MSSPSVWHNPRLAASTKLEDTKRWLQGPVYQYCVQHFSSVNLWRFVVTFTECSLDQLLALHFKQKQTCFCCISSKNDQGSKMMCEKGKRTCFLLSKWRPTISLSFVPLATSHWYLCCKSLFVETVHICVFVKMLWARRLCLSWRLAKNEEISKVGVCFSSAWKRVPGRLFPFACLHSCLCEANERVEEFYRTYCFEGWETTIRNYS